MIEALVITAGLVFVVSGLSWAYDRWIRPKMMRRWVQQMLARIRAGEHVAPPKQSEFRLSMDAAALTVIKKSQGNAPVNVVAWSDVVRVVAFKRDLFTVDCLCLALVTADGMTTEVDEEMEGWEELTTALPKYLPGSKDWSAWFGEVAFPAFETNMTVIFEANPKA